MTGPEPNTASETDGGQFDGRDYSTMGIYSSFNQDSATETGIAKMIKTMFQHAKKHPGLIPQFFFMTLGIAGATLYLIRLARGPHVTLWDKKNNPEPWNKLDPTYQYKFVAVNTDYKNLKKEGPDF